jgi:hypothetical protein
MWGKVKYKVWFYDKQFEEVDIKNRKGFKATLINFYEDKDKQVLIENIKKK